MAQILAATEGLDRGGLQEYAANTDMRTLKVIFGSVCLIAALPLGFFAWECFLASNYAGELMLKFIPAAFTLGLIRIGFFLISRRCSVISTRAKTVTVIFFGLLE